MTGYSREFFTAMEERRQAQMNRRMIRSKKKIPTATHSDLAVFVRREFDGKIEPPPSAPDCPLMVGHGIPVTRCDCPRTRELLSFDGLCGISRDCPVRLYIFKNI